MEVYDVAFSLLSSDEPVARSIQAYFPERVRSFLYSTQQQELMIARDGFEAFPSTFRVARICVILFREGWGETPWTRIEKRTLGDRWMDDGSEFLVLIRLDESAIPAWFPRTDFWVDYSVEGPKKAADYIVGRLERRISGSSRVTSRTIDRRPMPIARYQEHQVKITETFTPVRPEVCDGCTSAVVFRPLLRAKLPASSRWPASEEQFCPSCARLRGFVVMIPKGMTKDQLYAPGNPSFHEHLRRILVDPVLPSLSENAKLRGLGVVHVGAVHSASHLALIVSTSAGGDFEVPFAAYELEKHDIRSEIEIINYLIDRIATPLTERVL